VADAVLLLAHGTADSVEEIPEYLLRVTGRAAASGGRRRGSAPSLLADRRQPAHAG